MLIDTERLSLIPLTAQQLRLWVEDMPSLEKELHCECRAEPMEGRFKDIVKGQIEIAQNDAANYLYHTFWLLLRKADRIVVGSADFKNVPNENNEVEIGYGLGKEYEHNGYMTEAIQGMCNWAMTQAGVSHVIAETECSNIPSQNLLKRCGFAPYTQDKTIWWRL